MSGVHDSDTALAGLQTPLVEVMESMRAMRRLRPDPVDDAIVLRLVELATKAPTGSNGQNWQFVVVRDRDVMHRLGRLNHLAVSLYGRIGARAVRDQPEMLRALDAVRWQDEHWNEIPVVIVACLEGPRAPFPPIVAATYYGSIFPSVQNLLLAARAMGLGAGVVTLPLWSTTAARRILGLPFSVQPCAMVPIGWPLGRFGPTSRKPVGEILHVDRYGNQPFRT